MKNSYIVFIAKGDPRHPNPSDRAVLVELDFDIRGKDYAEDYQDYLLHQLFSDLEVREYEELMVIPHGYVVAVEGRDYDSHEYLEYLADQYACASIVINELGEEL